MDGAAVVVALAAGGFVLLALLNVSFPATRGPARALSARREAVQSWRSQAGDERAGQRVLLVGRSNREVRADVGRLRAAGYDVRTCTGPDGTLETFPYGGCLILNEEQCPLASGADAIVFGLELDSGAARSVLRGYRKFHPGTPVCVRTSDRESEWYAHLLRDCRVEHGEWKENVVAGVEHALAAGTVPEDPSGSSGAETSSEAERSAHDRPWGSSEPSAQAQPTSRGRSS